MSEKVIRYCDRCNKNQEGDGDKIGLAVGLTFTYKYGHDRTYEYELCEKCSEKFRKIFINFLNPITFDYKKNQEDRVDEVVKKLEDRLLEDYDS